MSSNFLGEKLAFKKHIFKDNEAIYSEVGK